MSSPPPALNMSPPPKASSNLPRYLFAILVGLVLTAIFFRSVLPRLPRLFFRGRLRIRRAGLRGVRGIEYRSKRFHNDSAAFSRNENQLEIKIQRVYAAYHLPYFLRKSQHQPSVVPSKSGAIITIHLQGVGVRLPRSELDENTLQSKKPKRKPSSDSAATTDTEESLTLEQQEELRLQRLMSSPPLSPISQPKPLFPEVSQLRSPTFPKLDPAQNDDVSSSEQPPASAFHRAGLMSIQSVLSLASWFRCFAMPALNGLVLRAFRAALYLLTTSLPVLTSLVSIEIHRIEIYVQEAETVARIGRAGLTFSMSPNVSIPDGISHKRSRQTQESTSPQPPNSSTLSFSQFIAAMRMMPTRMNTGARGAASYLVAGMSRSNVRAHLRVDSIDLFEANFQPEFGSRPASRAPSRRNSLAPTSRPSTPSSPHPRSGHGLTSPSQSDHELDSAADYTPNVDESFLWPPRPRQRRNRSNSASRLSKMSSGSLRGFADRWADWALEPLVDSDFHADSGWMRQRSEDGIVPQHLQTIPSRARIVSITGVTEFTASMLMGSGLTLADDGTLAAQLKLGATNVGLDAVFRVLAIVEERKARRAGLAPAERGISHDERSLLSKHVVQQKPSAAAMALRMVSSVSLSLPSVRVTASSDAILSSAGPSRSTSEGPWREPSLPPSREMAVSLTGFHYELKNSDPADPLHRRWLGTCGIHSKSRSEIAARSKMQYSSHRTRPFPRGAKVIEHRRTFLAEMSFASFDVHCVSRGRSRDSQLLFVGDFSIVTRSSWTPFGLLPSSPEHARLLLASDPNEHAATIEASIGGVETDVSMVDLKALVPIANEFSRRRQQRRKSIGIEQPARPKTDLEKLRRLPRIAAGFHIERTSLLLDASQGDKDELSSRTQPSDSVRPVSRKLTLTIPNVDFVFFGEYHDEYVKRPTAEKRVAYKALKSDNLEWPVSGLATFRAADVQRGKELDAAASQRSLFDSADNSNHASRPASSQGSSTSSQRNSETNLTMAETIERMKELQEKAGETDRPALTEKRPSIRDAMSKTGKVRLPGYSRRDLMAAETRFSLRYQFETGVRMDALESFLSLSSDPNGETRDFLRHATSPSNPDVGSSQHHLIAMHSFEVHGTGRVPGNVEPRSSSLQEDVPWLSAQDTVADFRANIEDVDIEAWQPSALDAYADIAAAVAGAKQSRAPLGNPSYPGGDAHGHAHEIDNVPSGEEDGCTENELQPLVDRLPGGLSLYMSIGRTVAHLGGQDRRIKDHIARGMGFEADRIVIEYAAVTETKTNVIPLKTNWGARTALELTEDLQLQASSVANRYGRARLARIVLHQAGIFPILDADLATQQHTEGTAAESFAHAKAPKGEAWPKEHPEDDSSSRPATSLLADSVWTFEKGDEHVHQSTQHRPRFRQQDRSNFIFFMPYAAFKAVVRPPTSGTKSALAGDTEEEVTITAEDTNLLAFKIDLLHTYCILLTLATFKNLMRRAKDNMQTPAQQNSVSKGHPDSDRFAAKRRSPTIACRFDIKEIHAFTTLPGGVRIFLRMRRLELRSDPRTGLSLTIETVGGAVESPKHSKGDVWEEAVRLRDWKVRLPPKQPNKKREVEIAGDAGLIRVPYGYAVNPIIDNTSVAIKATKQLVYQFLTDKDDSIIRPYAEDPKLLPDIKFSLRVLTIEAQDDPFETKLNLIWRAGLAENTTREEREVAFAAKAEAIAASRTARSSVSYPSSRSNGSFGSDTSSIGSDSDGDGGTSSFSHGTHSGVLDDVHVSYDEARAALNAFNSSSWARRYVRAEAEQTRRQEKVLKNIYGRFPTSQIVEDLPVKVLPIGKAAPLFRSTMYRLHLEVGQAHFPLEHLRDFIHDKGAGMPKDTAFSLLVPIHLKWQMEEWRIILRDYPLPMLHVPPTHRSETDPRKAWCFEGDIVIAEQLGGPESIRHVPAVVVPAATGRPEAVEYGLIVPKTAMPVKMYGTPTVKLHTPYPTRLVWGQSIQPTIQDVMRVVDGLTPPPHDPSPKLGFWDKLPLILHGHINIKLEDEGGFNIHLKGGRDPYGISGHAAGWVKSWKGNVELRIGYDNPEKEFFQILSHEFVLAVPDLCDYVDHAATGVLGGSDFDGNKDRQRDHEGDESYHDSHDRKSTAASFASSTRRYMKDPTFKKIVIKLTNGVRWGAGLHGERTCDDETCPRRPRCKGEPFYRECRHFNRIDHWKVITKTREHFDFVREDERRDSFQGWRSHHLHFALSVFSPKSGLPGCRKQVEDVSPLEAVNNFYFTPLAWEHFWAWMRLFNSAMSLPIRAGTLFPDSPPPSPKFGRYLGTMKYRIDLEPLFITHQYRQHNKDDWARGLRTHVGIKARIDTFTLDMHQRQQETIKDRPELGGPRIVFHKPFYEAEVCCESIDLKALAAQMREDSENDEAIEEREIGQNIFDDLFAKDVVIPDEELEWVDMNDLVELDTEPVKDPNPKIRMFPAMECPRFHYYRKVESKRERRAGEMQDRAKTRSSRREGESNMEDLLDRLERSKFGNEDTHTCMVAKNDKPYEVQRKFAQKRLQTIRQEIDRVLSLADDANPGSEGGSDGQENQQDVLNDLHGRERIISSFISHLARLQEHADRCSRAKEGGEAAPKRTETVDRSYLHASELASLYHDLGTFDNRYVAHNPTIFFSNVTRTLLLKYYYSSRLRRGYAHHMTATAVRYIRDLLKKKDNVNGRRNNYGRTHSGKTSHHLTPTTENANGHDILHEMLEDTVNHMTGKNGYSTYGWGCRPEDAAMDGMDAEMRPHHGISDEFVVEKSNACLLLKPQVVLRSDVDDNSTVIVSALRTRLQNYTVQDESCAEDSVNAIVLRRNFLALERLQCFHPKSSSKASRFANNHAIKHGFVPLPLEALVDLHGESRDFERIVPHTNATLYYDKFNKLRLSDSSKSVATFRKDGKPVQDHLHHHMDMILLNCPRFSVSANSEHFGALYNVVTDLILYRDPADRDHAKRLEEMMFSYDFTDVSGLADIVTALQLRIREAYALAEQYQAVSDRLNERGRAEFIAVMGEMLDLIQELNLIMDAITTSQDSKGGADREKKSALHFMAQAREVAWNMMGDEAGKLVAKLALRGISFSWLNKADNSAANTLSIQDLQALNVDPDAMFAEIISKHLRAPDHPMAKEGRFLDAMWSVLPPVGGISIVDMFEFNLHPVKIQIELAVGRKIMDYIFGTKRERDKLEEEQKRIENEVRQKEKTVTKKKSPFARLLGRQKHLLPVSAVQSSQSLRRPSTNESSLNLSHAPSRSASSTDLLSLRGPPSDGSRDDDTESISGRSTSKALTSNGSTAKTSQKYRPGSPGGNGGSKDYHNGNDRPGDQFAIAQRNAAEMRSRASAYRTFVYVKIPETIFCLSYKGEKQKSITDLYDLVFRTPNFEYHNSTFGYVDLAENFKKDVFKAAWDQKSSLLRAIITHGPNRKRNAMESIRAIRQATKGKDALPLDISVTAPDEVDAESMDGSSHFVESPTDTFSFRGAMADYQVGDQSAESGEHLGVGELEEDGDYHDGPSHTRHGTGQTLAGQIRDAWSASESRSDERHSMSQVDDVLGSATPRREPSEADHAPRGFPSIQSQSSNDSPLSDRRRGDSSSVSSSPYLQLPTNSPIGSIRRASLGTRAHSPSFKLNKLIPKSLRPRATSASLEAGRRNSSPLTEWAAATAGAGGSGSAGGTQRQSYSHSHRSSVGGGSEHSHPL